MCSLSPIVIDTIKIFPYLSDIKCLLVIVSIYLANQAFLMNHIRKGSRGTYKYRWYRFQKFCEGYGINPQWAPLPLIVKFIRHLYVSDVLWSVVMTAISAINKYHIVDKGTGNSIGQHPLASTTKRAF